MATATPNYALVKPELTDVYDITSFCNGNMDIIDSEMKGIDNAALKESYDVIRTGSYGNILMPYAAEADDGYTNGYFDGTHLYFNVSCSTGRTCKLVKYNVASNTYDTIANSGNLNNTYRVFGANNKVFVLYQNTLYTIKNGSLTPTLGTLTSIGFYQNEITFDGESKAIILGNIYYNFTTNTGQTINGLAANGIIPNSTCGFKYWGKVSSGSEGDSTVYLYNDEDLDYLCETASPDLTSFETVTLPWGSNTSGLVLTSTVDNCIISGQYGSRTTLYLFDLSDESTLSIGSIGAYNKGLFVTQGLLVTSGGSSNSSVDNTLYRLSADSVETVDHYNVTYATYKKFIALVDTVDTDDTVRWTDYHNLYSEITYSAKDVVEAVTGEKGEWEGGLQVGKKVYKRWIEQAIDTTTDTDQTTVTVPADEYTGFGKRILFGDCYIEYEYNENNNQIKKTCPLDKIECSEVTYGTHTTTLVCKHDLIAHTTLLRGAVHIAYKTTVEPSS